MQVANPLSFASFHILYNWLDMLLDAGMREFYRTVNAQSRESTWAANVSLSEIRGDSPNCTLCSHFLPESEHLRALDVSHINKMLSINAWEWWRSRTSMVIMTVRITMKAWGGAQVPSILIMPLPERNFSASVGETQASPKRTCLFLIGFINNTLRSRHWDWDADWGLNLYKHCTNNCALALFNFVNCRVP